MSIGSYLVAKSKKPSIFRTSLLPDLLSPLEQEVRESVPLLTTSSDSPLLSYPDIETLSHPQDPSPQLPTLASSEYQWQKSTNYWGRTDARDLAALLAYGPPHIPYTYGWTDNRVEQVRHFKQWQFVAVNKICSRIAAMMPNISWIQSDSLELAGGYQSPENARNFLRLRLFGERDRRRALTPLMTHERLEPVPSNHPLHRLLRDPNNQDTSWDLWYETMLFLLLTGSAYWWIPPGIGNLPAAIWVVPSHWMWPIVGKEKIIEAWEIRPVEGNYLRRRLPAEEIIHFRRKNPISKLDGFSPLTAINKWVDAQESISGAMMKSYRNGPLPNVAISFDGTMNDPTDEDLRRIEGKFLTRLSGENNAGKPIFTPPGVKITPLTIEPNKMVFGQTGDTLARNILCGYGVPPGSVFLEGDTIRDEMAFCSGCITEWCRFLGWTATERLGRRYPKKNGGEIRIWYEAPRVDDAKQTNEDLKTDMLASAVSPNEVRVLRGREPWDDPEMDKPIRPVNMENSGSLPGGGEHIPDEPKPKKPKPGQPALNPDDSKSLYMENADGTWSLREMH